MLEAMNTHELYKEVNAGRLVGVYKQVEDAVLAQTENLAKYPSSPYTAENLERLKESTAALRMIGDELREWHKFLHTGNPSAFPGLFGRA